MTKADWASEQARRIAATVRQLRANRSGQWLSDETAKAGHRISRTTISELESGKRKAVTTAELCVLAWALQVPPMRLLYPDLPDGPVDIVPGVTVPSIKAATWFSGEAELGELEPKPARLESDSDPSRENILGWAADKVDRLLELSRERNEIEQRIGSLVRVNTRLKSEDPSGAKAVAKDIADAESRKTKLNRQLRQIDGAVVDDEAASDAR
jgi:hypothetical protein